MNQTIVVSAVNLVEAGTLAILRDCLAYLSQLAGEGEYRVVAIVYKKELALFPNIEYLETTWPKKRWTNRLWFEYVTAHRISKRLSPVSLWLSLHDTSPSVVAARKAVYCHNAYPFYRWRLHDLLFAPKIALFAMFTKLIYRPNIFKNDYIVVQQRWFRKAMAQMFGLRESSIIVASPRRTAISLSQASAPQGKPYTFLFAASPNSHKNFEVICKAASLLEGKRGVADFRVLMTVSGHENKYTRWLHKNWGGVRSLHFVGFLEKRKLERTYHESHCLIFPSKCETWGLPISEFACFGKPMLLADLPYAHETAEGSPSVAFFDPDNEHQLASLMEKLILGDSTSLALQQKNETEQPVAASWEQLFELLLGDNSKHNAG